MGGSDTAPGRRAGPLQALALLLGGLAVLGLAAWGYGRLAPDLDAARIIRLELAGSLAAARRVVGADAAPFADALRADFLLIGGYVAGLLLLDVLHPPTALDGDLTMRLVQAAAFTKFTVLVAAAALAVVVVGVTLSRLFLLTYLGTLAGVLWRKRETIGRQVGVVRGWFTGAGAGTGTPRAVPTSLAQRLIVLAVLPAGPGR